MCGRMCSCERLGKAAGLNVAVRFWGWMGSFGESEAEEWYGRTVDAVNGGRGGEASRSAWFGSIGDARTMEEGRWKGEVEERVPVGGAWIFAASSVRGGP